MKAYNSGHPKKKIIAAVVFGGQSSEHQISCISARAVVENMDTSRYEIRTIGITKKGEWLPFSGDAKAISDGTWEEKARLQLQSGKQRPIEPVQTPSPMVQSEVPLTQTQNSNVQSEVPLTQTPTSNVQSEVSLTQTPASNVQSEVPLTQTQNSTVQTIGQSACLQLLYPSGFPDQQEPIDVVLPILHGPNGEDGSVQGVFQLAGVPYVGCGILASALGMDKSMTKVAFNQSGILQANYLCVLRSEIDGGMDVLYNRVQEKLGYPCFVKPSSAGSSVGVTKVKRPEDLENALRFAAKYDRKVLIEEFIDGREVECAVLGNDEPMASTVGEVLPCNEFYDYTAKYLDDRSQTIIPADLSAEVTEKIQRLAVKAFKAIDAAGLSRVDFFIEKGTERIVLNEINTMPGFTSISMYAKLWQASGLSYSELLDRLIQLALERHADATISLD